jgi:hypothetical protein
LVLLVGFAVSDGFRAIAIPSLSVDRVVDPSEDPVVDRVVDLAVH